MLLWILCVLSQFYMSDSCSVPDEICTNLTAVQDEIVNVHNMFRREVVPPASNMLKMETLEGFKRTYEMINNTVTDDCVEVMKVNDKAMTALKFSRAMYCGRIRNTRLSGHSWSEEVAALAQRWADVCKLEHGAPSNRMLGTYEMGENLFMSSENMSWTDVVKAWHNEVNNYKYPTGSTNGKPIGHFTQVIWFSSYKVGCGVTRCGKLYFYACQYYRAGNYKGVPPYSPGEPCSACPHACDNKLCTNPCPYINQFINCSTLKKQSSLCSGYLKLWCAAQCFCTTEIVPTY